MAFEGPQAAEAIRYDPHSEMPLPFTRTSMAGVEMTLVDDLELYRVKRVLQQPANLLDARGVLRGGLMTRIFS